MTVQDRIDTYVDARRFLDNVGHSEITAIWDRLYAEGKHAAARLCDAWCNGGITDPGCVRLAEIIRAARKNARVEV